jgi:hypothetical protein
MFWGFVLRLFIGSLVAPFAFSLMIVVLLRLLQPTATKGEWKVPPADYLRLGLLMLAQLYFWGMWAAYCAGLAWVRSFHQGMPTAFLYYAIAFLFLSGPIGYLSFKEQKLADSIHEARGIRRGMALYRAFAIVAFIIFALWPRLMPIIKPYGWFVALTVPLEEVFGDALEAQYLRALDGWVARGGPISEVDHTVVPACGQLVMVRLSTGEKIALSTTRRKDFHFRVDVCVKTTVNRVYPQPDLTKENVAAVCDDPRVPLFAVLCKRSGLR